MSEGNFCKFIYLLAAIGIFLGLAVGGMVTLVEYVTYQYKRNLCEGPYVQLWLFEIHEDKLIVGLTNHTRCCLANVLCPTNECDKEALAKVYAIGNNYAGKYSSSSDVYTINCPSEEWFDKKIKWINSWMIGWSIEIGTCMLALCLSCFCSKVEIVWSSME